MDIQDDREFDKRMRTAFDPDAESINRVVSAAMQPRSCKPARLRFAATAALAGIAIIIAIFWFLPADVHVENIRVEYVGKAVLVEFPDGSSKIMSLDKAYPGSPTIANLIILEGDLP